MSTDTKYCTRRQSASIFVPLRGLRYHVHRWGDTSLATPARPPLVLLHGWMDVGASFQFVVDALAEAEGFERLVYAPDWRGFGRTEAPATDTYWFPDYLADLDAVLDGLVPHGTIDLVGHSMGGNVVMSYAGLRPARIRRLVNLEGFGMPETRPEQAPKRLLQWLDELKTPATLRDYASAAEVADRLMANNPLLTRDKAARRRPLARSGRPGAPAREPRALPQGRGAGRVEAHRRAAAVGGRRPDRRHQVVGSPLPARGLRGPPGHRAAGGTRAPLAVRPHAAPRPAAGAGAAHGGVPGLTLPGALHDRIAGSHRTQAIPWTSNTSTRSARCSPT
jgi:pimeloyl-ACP methyl ester carboxylesterase